MSTGGTSNATTWLPVPTHAGPAQQEQHVVDALPQLLYPKPPRPLPPPLRSATIPVQPYSIDHPSRSATLPAPGAFQPTVAKSDLRPLPAINSRFIDGFSTQPGSQGLLQLPTLTHWDSTNTVVAAIPEQAGTSGEAAAIVAVPQASDSPVQITPDPANVLRSRNSSSLSVKPDMSSAVAEEDVTKSARKRYQAFVKFRFEMVPRYLKRYWTYILLFFLAALVSASIAIGWSLRLRTFNGVNIDDPGFGVGVYLSADLVNIDPTMQVMTLEWSIDNFQINITSDNSPIFCDQNATSCPDVAIYFDANLLQNSNSGGSNTVPSNILGPDPVFILNGTNWILNQQLKDERFNSPLFRTDVLISDDGTGRTAQSYPFEKYNAQLAMYALTIPDNDSIGIYVEETAGIAVGFNAKLTGSGVGFDNMTYIKDIEITRGAVIRTYAVFIVMAIWVVTLTFVVAGVAAVVLGKGIRAEVLVLPVATLFAFTQLRGTLPGAPAGFGADIDFVGILPCLALLTLCSVFMTAIFLFRNPEQNTRTYDVVFSDGASGQVTLDTEGQKAVV